MPTAAGHLAQADHNEKFYEQIDRNSFGDWAVTALFYTAVHYVNSYLEAKSQRPANHEERGRLIRSHAKTSGFFNNYERLRVRCWAARYDPGIIFKVAEIEDLRKNDLEPIKKALAP